MNLSPTQRKMLLNAKSFISTVSRQAELAKDAALAHALADVVAELHRIMMVTQRFTGRPSLTVLPLTRKDA